MLSQWCHSSIAAGTTWVKCEIKPMPIWIVKIFTARFLKVGLLTFVSLPRLKGNKMRRKSSLFTLCWSNPKFFSPLFAELPHGMKQLLRALHGVGGWGESSAFQQWVCSFKGIPMHLGRILLLQVKNHSILELTYSPENFKSTAYHILKPANVYRFQLRLNVLRISLKYPFKVFCNELIILQMALATRILLLSHVRYNLSLVFFFLSVKF